MTKKPVSLEAALAVQVEQAPSAANATENIVPLMPAQTKPLIEKATVYLPRPALKRIRQMALDQDKRLNDLLQEGIDLMLAHYGQPSLKEFESK